MAVEPNEVQKMLPELAGQLEPTPVPGCAGCLELAKMRDRAREVGDSVSVHYCNEYLRKHPEDH